MNFEKIPQYSTYMYTFNNRFEMVRGSFLNFQPLENFKMIGFIFFLQSTGK